MSELTIYNYNSFQKSKKSVFLGKKLISNACLILKYEYNVYQEKKLKYYKIFSHQHSFVN